MGRARRLKATTDYWATVITAIKAKYHEFRFIAEAYWDLEWELQQQGFDFCYDKKLYDRMEHGDAESVRQHLLADSAYQEKMVRFIENHDEPRAAATFPDGKGRAAAVAILTLPGARLLHEGQFEGRKVRLPVFLGRRPAEPVDHDLSAFYARLLKEVDHDVFRNGEWRLCERSGWPDNQSCQNILAWCWAKDSERYFIVINFSDQRAQALVRVLLDELRGKTWRLNDLMAGESYDRGGDEMRDSGLYVDLKPWQCHFFKLSLAQVKPETAEYKPFATGTGEMIGSHLKRVVLSAALVFFTAPLFYGQSLAPRAYVITPVDSTAVTVTSDIRHGGVLFDESRRSLTRVAPFAGLTHVLSLSQFLWPLVEHHRRIAIRGEQLQGIGS